MGYVFTGLFSFELVLRCLAQGRAFVSLKNREWRWNLLDSVIVLASLYEVGMDARARNGDAHGHVHGLFARFP